MNLRQYQSYAVAAFEATGLIGITLPQEDLNAIREKAVARGMSYQALIATIVHQYVTGNLVKKSRAASNPRLRPTLLRRALQAAHAQTPDQHNRTAAGAGSGRKREIHLSYHVAPGDGKRYNTGKKVTPIQAWRECGTRRTDSR